MLISTWVFETFITIGYARESTRDQKLDFQVDALKRVGCERIFQDLANGSKTARPALDELPGQLRSGDVLVIRKLDRMDRCGIWLIWSATSWLATSACSV